MGKVGVVSMGLSEAKIVALATLPLCIGSAWLFGLRRPEPVERIDAHVLRAMDAPAQLAAPHVAAGWQGVVVAGNNAEIGAEVGGTISESWLVVGARVKEGAPLVRID